MRRIRRALLPLLTALLIAAGAAMPYAACRLQDNQLDGAEERSLDSVSLTLRQKGGIGETARLMADRYSMVEWSGETAMTEEEVLEVGLKALEEMRRANLIPAGRLNVLKNLDSGGAVPALVVSHGGERSGIIWQCWWTLEEDELMEWVLLIEDATGLVVEATVGGAYFTVDEDIYLQMDRWLTFFQDYYGIEIPSVQEGLLYSPPWRFLMAFDPGDGLEGQCELVLDMYNGVASFFFTNAGQWDNVPVPEGEVTFDAGPMQKR